jgi:hypothetical protein
MVCPAWIYSAQKTIPFSLTLAEALFAKAGVKVKA